MLNKILRYLNKNKRFAIRHYKRKINVVKMKILDIEFLIDEYKMTREGFRTEYDRIKEMQDACVVKIEEEKKKEDPDKTIIEQMTKLKEKYDPDVAKLTLQMDTIDKQIQGPLENGQQCLTESIEGLRTVMQLLRNKIKSI